MLTTVIQGRVVVGLLATFLLLAETLAAQPASPQKSRVAPLSPAARAPRLTLQAGYPFHNESPIGSFIVQRWVSAASPEVSPAGMCECLTLIYQGARRIPVLGTPGSIEAISVVAPTGRDINADSLPDLVVSNWSCGAHCCYSATAYSVGAQLTTLLSLDTVPLRRVRL